MHRTGRWLPAALLILAACSGDTPSPVGPVLQISDAAHGGTRGFYFLPPMVRDQITPTGAFDPTLLPQVVVEVCELNTPCSPPIARFLPDGPFLSRVAVSQFTIGDRIFEQYVALWRTDGPAVSVDKTYRVTVLAAGRPLGHADVKLVRTTEQAQAVDRTQYTLWVKGLPLPIRFRIEEGVLAPGDAVSLVASDFPASVVAGEASSLTLTARDQHGKIATGYRGTITFTSSDPEATLPADYTFTAEDAGVHTFPGVVLATAGSVNLRAADAANADLFADVTLTVQPAAAAALQLTGLSDGVAGVAQTVTVTARDASGNVVTGYTGTIAFTSSDPRAVLPEPYRFTADDAGTHAFAGIALRTAGAFSVTATDQALPAIEGVRTVTVAPAAAAELILEGISSPVTAGVANDLTVTARDAFGNIATGYTGTVQLSSTDAAALLPAPYSFQASDAGSRAFTGGVTLRTAGSQSLTAGDGTLAATLAIAVDPAVAAVLRFTTQPSGALAGETIVPAVVVTAYDAFANPATGFGGAVTLALGTNPGSGILSGTLTRTAVHGVATFNDIGIDRAAIGYTLIASSPGLTAATSEPLDITAPVPTEVRWVNPVSGSWSDGSKWSTGTPPTAAQAVFIDVPGTYTVTLNVNATVDALAVGASSGAQTLAAGSPRILTVTGSAAILGTGRLALTGATVNGPGTLGVAAGGSLTLSGGTINAPLMNAGTVVSSGNTGALTGGVTTAAGSMLRVLSVGFGGARLTVSSGFTNHGTIELTGTAANGVTFEVNGTLRNATGGTIASLLGTSGGGRALLAQLDNQGTLTVAQSLTITGPGAQHVNSGLIELTGGDLALTNSSFTNTGTLTIMPGRHWSHSGGTFTQAAGATLDGGGAMTLSAVNPALFQTSFTLGALTLSSGTAGFATDITTATLALGLTGATVNGPGTLTNAAGKTLTVNGGAINAPLVNAGTLVTIGNVMLNGAVSTATGSLLRVLSVGFGGSQLTVASGFTNNGTIELTGTAPNGVTLDVNGTLRNATGATIASLPGTAGGGRSLFTRLENEGTLTVAQSLTITEPGAQHLNGGLIELTSGDLTVTHGASVTSTGTVTIMPGRLWTSSGAGGGFTLASGATLNGGGAMSLTSQAAAHFQTSFGLSALTLSGATAHFATDITTATLALGLSGATLNGPGTITNAAGKTLTMSGGAINAPLVNAGSILITGTAAINGSFTTEAGSRLEVRSVGFGGSTLNVASGFTNHGAIDLTGTTSNGVVLNVGGTLVNAPGATISNLLGAGGGRTLGATIDNQGTLSLSHSLTINRPSAAHSSSGTIVLNAGDLTIAQTGTSPSFTNQGVIDLVGSGTMRLSGGTFSNASTGRIQGPGTFETGSSTPFANAGSVAANLVRVGNALTGTGAFAPATVEFVGNATLIPTTANFVYTEIRVLSSASFAGSRDIEGNLTVAGGNLTIGAHEIVLEGDFATLGGGLLTMQNAAGILNVRGNATFGGGSTNGRLTAGALRLGGNFTQGGGSPAAFAASLGHLTELDGGGEQTVFFANPGAAATASHFHGLVLFNFQSPIVLGSAAFVNSRVGTMEGQLTRIRSAGHTLTVAGLSVDGLDLDNTPLRVVTGATITRFTNSTFRNMDPTVTQLRLDRLNDAVMFNNIAFLTVPTTGVYVHLVDTDGGGAALFTVTMQGTTPATHGGRIIESVAGQLLGWPQ